MVSSVGGTGSNSSVSSVLQQQQKRVTNQQEEKRITDQRVEESRQLQESKREEQINNSKDDRKGSLVNITI